MLREKDLYNPDNRISSKESNFLPYQQTIARIKRIFRALPDGILCIDGERRIIMLNPAMEEILGYREEELVGQLTTFLHPHPTEQHLFPDDDTNLIDTNYLSPSEINFKKKDGSLVSAEISSTIVEGRDGEKNFFLHMMRDVTKRKRLEKRLRQMEQKYRTVADFAYDMECWRLSDGSFKYISPSCERITGYSARQFIDNPKLFQEIILPEDQAIWQEYLEKSASFEKQEELQFRIVRKDGEVRWIEHACQPVMSDTNEFLGYRSSNRDITKRKLNENKLLQALHQIEEYKEQLEAESVYLRKEIQLTINHADIVGNSNAIEYVFFKIEQIAPTDTTVLLLGETGTGKELIARAIHKSSPRKDRPFIKINCATLPADLIESELFGHEKGSFTSAHGRQIGRFELAHNATIFLDEIGELPLKLQSKLLRVLQEGEFERLGGAKTIKVDARVIAATNRDLEQDVTDGLFRSDLWYRLNVFPITAPPLRDRKEDISQLVGYFTERFSKKLKKHITKIPTAVIHKLEDYHWPGNVRELENIIERAVINSSGSKLALVDELKSPLPKGPQNFQTLEKMERDYIVQVLEETNWKVSGKNSAAEILGLKRSTLRAKLDKFDIKKP